MSKDFELSSNLLNKLSDEELYLLITIFSKEELLIPIKKCPKKFKNETRGCIIDKKSKLLMERLPNIYFDRIKKFDIYIINVMNKNLNLFINRVNNHIFEVTSDKEFIEKTISSNSNNNFPKLIEIISDELKPEYIKLFFKLLDKELNDAQDKYIDTQIKTINIKKELKKKISEQLENEYKNKITTMENEYKVEVFNKVKTIKEIQQKLNHINIELYEEKNNSNLLYSEIEKIKIEKNNESDVLKNHINELNFTIDKIEEERFELKNSLQAKNLTIESLNKQLSMKYNDYSVLAQEKWNSNNEKLLNIQNTLYKKCEDLEATKIILNNNIRELENQKVQLEDKISEYKNIINGFIENIDKKIIERALYDSMLKINTKNYIQVENKEYKINDLYVKDNEIATNIKECKDIFDFSENIAVNLENIGVKGAVDEVADYIIGILASGMVPLICGYRAREIATSISFSYSGETPYIITLPNGYTNSRELVEIYNLAESNVVLIEDAIGTMNENALMPLLRERSQKGFSSKLLLLSTENIDSIKYMPSNLFNQVALVMVSKYGVTKKGDYEVSDARKVLEEFTLLNDFQYEHKTIKKLTYNLKLGNPYELLRAIIIAYSSKLSNFKVALQGYLKSELMFICRWNDMIDGLEENIQKYQLGDDLLEFVRGVVNE